MAKNKEGMRAGDEGAPQVSCTSDVDVSGLRRPRAKYPLKPSVLTMSTSRLDPPQYVLISKAGSQTTNAETLIHPTVIHYHYADDPPLPLVPIGQTLLVMDFDDKDPNTLPLVHSLSEDVAVTGVRVSEAAGFVPPTDIPVNPFMYVIETTQRDPPQRYVRPEVHQRPHILILIRHTQPPVVDQAFIAQWRLQYALTCSPCSEADSSIRNDRIRRVVDYGTPAMEAPLSPVPLSATSPPQPHTLELPSLMQ